MTNSWGGLNGETPYTTGDWGTGGAAGAFTDLAPDIDWAQMRTPTQDWQQFMLGVAPGMQRAPMQEMGQRLRARYALASPYMENAVCGGYEPSFAQFLSGGIAGQADYNTLRSRAQAAANIAGLSQADYANQLMEAGGPGSAAGRRLAMQAASFNPLQGGSTANQAAIANLLALQRGPGQGTGSYQGAVGDAIQRAMSSMYTARQAAGYDPNTFLNWYMGMTNPATTNGNGATNGGA